MHLKEALKKIQQSPELPGLFVVMLAGHGMPTSLLSSFYASLKKQNDLTFLEVDLLSFAECQAQFEMSFLGMRKWYVLRNFDSLDAAAKKKWYGYLKTYQGPHTLMFFESLGALPRGRKQPAAKKLPLADTGTTLCIEIPAFVDIPLYTELYRFFYPSIAPEQLFIKTLFAQQQRLSLQDAVRMMSYQTVVGRRCSPFFDQWYTKLVLSEVSLFTLSQYFFGKNPKLFLVQWKACKDDFPSEFWVAYWSEQLWHAAQFIEQAQKYGLAEAKKSTSRLPFTFIQTDWKHHSLRSLSAAHDALYTLDYTLKNSGGMYALELWYHASMLR